MSCAAPSARTPACVLLVSHAGMNLAIFRRSLILRLLSEGAAVTCAVPEDRYARALQDMGAAVEPLAVARGSLDPLALYKAARALGRVVRRLGPDVVHSFTHQPNIIARLALSGTALSGTAPAGAGGPVLVNSVTGLGSMFLGAGLSGLARQTLMHWAYRATALACRALVFQNRDDMDFFAARRMTGPARAVLVRGSGVDTARFAPDAASGAEVLALRQELGIAPEAVVATMAGRLLRDKGVAEFLAAADMLRERHPRAVFLLAGEPDPGNPSDMGPAVMAAARSRPNIKALGWREDMPRIWAASDVAVLPSFREGLPVTMQEAMACGLPVVVTDVPGCREVADDGRNGLLVRPRDAESLAEALSRLLADPGLRERMGAAGRAKALAEFDALVLAGEVLDLYRDLLADRSEAR